VAVPAASATPGPWPATAGSTRSAVAAAQAQTCLKPGLRPRFGQPIEMVAFRAFSRRPRAPVSQIFALHPLFPANADTLFLHISNSKKKLTCRTPFTAAMRLVPKGPTRNLPEMRPNKCNGNCGVTQPLDENDSGASACPSANFTPGQDPNAEINGTIPIPRTGCPQRGSTQTVVGAACVGVPGGYWQLPDRAVAGHAATTEPSWSTWPLHSAECVAIRLAERKQEPISG
jgi:hypothetical protein